MDRLNEPLLTKVTSNFFLYRLNNHIFPIWNQCSNPTIVFPIRTINATCAAPPKNPVTNLKKLLLFLNPSCLC